MTLTTWPWIGFALLVVVLLGIDLGMFHRRPRTPSLGEALAWSALWIAAALLFNVFVYHLYERHWFGIGLEIGHELGGSQAALKFFTGYLIEKSLSLDNIFVIAMIFAYFRVPAEHQHRLLFWGVSGAIIMRAVLIVVGVALIRRFEWFTYLFGVVLLVTAARMLAVRHDTLDPGRNPLIRAVQRYLPVTEDFFGARFIARVDGRLAATPMLLALLLVESADLLFAVDSIPAILAVTDDPFLVLTSNVFAILGLRSLYFVLASVMARFRYVKMSLVFVLAFVGVKMLLAHHHPIPTEVSLATIVAILLVGFLASVFTPGRDPAALASPLAEHLSDLARLTYRQARRVVILIFGSTLLLLGAALLVLPGPGIPFVLIGLAVLGTEFVWARILLARARRETARITDSTRRWIGDTAGRVRRKQPRGKGPPAHGS
jgi:tellurite resistance protein TerC